MKILAIILAVILAYLALSQATAHGPFFTLRNPEFVVALAFLLFAAILLWFGVPRRIAGLLDQRAETIRSELAETRKRQCHDGPERGAGERERAAETTGHG